MSGMLAFSLSTFCLPLLGPNDRLGPILSLSLGVSLLQLATSGGFYFSHRDIGGRFAGTLFGITNTLAQVPGFATTMTTARIAQNVRVTRVSAQCFFHALF